MKFLSIVLLAMFFGSAKTQDTIPKFDKWTTQGRGGSYEDSGKLHKYYLTSEEYAMVLLNRNNKGQEGEIRFWNGRNFVPIKVDTSTIHGWHIHSNDTAKGTNMRPAIKAAKKLVNKKPKVKLDQAPQWNKMTGAPVSYIHYGCVRFDDGSICNTGAKTYFFDTNIGIAKEITKRQADSIINSKRILSTESKTYKRIKAVGREDIPTLK